MGEVNKTNDGNSQLSIFCSQDLMSWSYQVARGMEYISQKKVASVVGCLLMFIPFELNNHSKTFLPLDNTR